MRKFQYRFLLFGLILFAVIALVFYYPASKYFRYNYVTKGGCVGRSNWIYHRIFENTTPIDLAFVGTSHTLNAIQDSIIEKHINDIYDGKNYLVNLAYCGLGRDWDFKVVEDLFQHQNPKILVVEIRENESIASHPCFPFIADASDVLGAPKFINQSYFDVMYSHLLFKIQYIKNVLLNQSALTKHLPKHLGRFGYNPQYGLADINELNQQKDRIEREKNKWKVNWVQDKLNDVPFYYVESIAVMAKKKGVKLYFLYLPAYGHSLDSTFINRFIAYGELILPDTSILNNKAFWFDGGHFNVEGAEQISNLVSERIVNANNNLHSTSAK